MSPAQLHGFLKNSLDVFSPPANNSGLRALVEAGGIEGFLTDLLFIELHSKGHKVSREFPIGKRCAADIALHDSGNLYIEVKQLNLKDGCKYAPPNLAKDLLRHGSSPSLGIMYLVDERKSTSQQVFKRFGGANRRAKHDVASVFAGLPQFFKTVFPTNIEDALLREFQDAGRAALYGFIVSV